MYWVRCNCYVKDIAIAIIFNKVESLESKHRTKLNKTTKTEASTVSSWGQTTVIAVQYEFVLHCCDVIALCRPTARLAIKSRFMRCQAAAFTSIPKYSLVVIVFNSALYHRAYRQSWFLHFDQNRWRTNWRHRPAALWLAATRCNTLRRIKKLTCQFFVVALSWPRVVP